MIWNLINSHWSDILAVGTVVGGWAWAKVRGKRAESLRDRLLSLGRQFMPDLIRLVGDPDIQRKARANLHLHLFAALSKLGVKPSKLTDAIIDSVADEVMEELAEYLTQHSLDQFIRIQEATLGTLRSAK